MRVAAVAFAVVAGEQSDARRCYSAAYSGIKHMQVPEIEISHADRLSACRQQIEEAVHKMIFGEQHVEFSPAEIAMAIADVADDYILTISKKNRATH
ncbi:hypothetical protein [Rhizobium sp. 18055]|jgi:uncharacterized protein YfcZ (UPF0381/DUF406 family)|uniref:hypothetical protein n=1 Tax=Rhizobium sp. 18055 TaxID=2681403 RepID=UPI001FCEEBE1|nr:hypothetical protein [Rhizobium sp. 18055]